MKNKDKVNYDVFWILGISFIGAGITFLAAVNRGIGASLIALGVTWMIIGLSKRGRLK